MSVSSRSPTTSGRRAPVRRTHSACMAGSGLPVTSGRWPVIALTTPTIAPLPGQRPARRRDRRVGVGGHVPRAVADGDDRLGELGPADLAAVALDDRGRLVLGALDDGEPGRPRARPRRRGRRRAGRGRRRPNSSATTVAAAWELVMTSAGSAGTPSSVRCAATSSGVRAALLVTKPSRMPSARAAASARDAGHRVRAHVDDAVEVEQGHVEHGAGRRRRLPAGEGLRSRSCGLRRLPGPDAAQGAGVVPEVRAHRDGQGQVLGGQRGGRRPGSRPGPRPKWA